ncbi:MAG: prepilin-type N-terminal cleavage/methylation domain-containing protein [Bacillota bacterium]|nr:prepilin-type N-terminal cleavage/methylation domain-containing protein [Bacillota bacterium]
MNRKKKGVTLVELIVCIAVLAIVMTAVFQLSSFENKMYTTGNTEIDNQQNLRIAVQSLTNSIKRAENLPASPPTDDSAGFTMDGTSNYADLTSIDTGITSDDKKLMYTQDIDGSCYLFLNKKVGSSYEIEKISMNYTIDKFVPVKDEQTGKYISYDEDGQELSRDPSINNLQYIQTLNYFLPITSVSTIDDWKVFYSNSISLSPLPSASDEFAKVKSDGLSASTMSSSQSISDTSFTPDSLYLDREKRGYYAVYVGNVSGKKYIVKVQPYKIYNSTGTPVTIAKGIGNKDDIVINYSGNTVNIEVTVTSRGQSKTVKTSIALIDHNQGGEGIEN